MGKGRPRKIGTEACSTHRDKLGFTYPNYVCKKSAVYCYPKFRHNDRTIGDHYVYDASAAQYTREYDRKKTQVTDFQFHPESTIPMKQASMIPALPIVIIYLRDVEYPEIKEACPQCSGKCTYTHDLRCGACNGETVLWCPQCLCHIDFSERIDLVKIPIDQILKRELKKLKKKSIKLRELEWLLKHKTLQTLEGDSQRAKRQRQVNEFVQKLKNLLEEGQPPYYKVIITYGKDALTDAHRILRSPSFRGKIEEELDKYGVLAKIEQWRNKKEYSAR